MFRRAALLVLLAACGDDDGAADVDSGAPGLDAGARDAGPADGGTPDSTLPPPSCEGRWIAATLSAPSIGRTDALLRADTPAPEERVRLRMRALSSRSGVELRLGDVPRDRFVVLHVARAVRGALRASAAHWEPLGGGFVLARFARAAPGAIPVRYLGQWSPDDKLGLALRSAPRRVHDLDVHRMAGDAIEVVRARGDLADARAIAADPDVLDIERHHAPEPTMDRARAAVHADEAQGFSIEDDLPVYSGRTGRGACIAVVDTGIYASHPDFWEYDWRGVATPRVIGDTVPEGGGFHGTLVAGFIAGNGWVSAGDVVGGRTGTPFGFRGIAPGARLVSVLSSRPTPWNAAFLDHRCHASNHSHTQSNGGYSRSSLDWDRTMFFGALRGEEAAPPRPVVFSMGNNGAYHVHGDIPVRGYYGCSAPAKDPIVVGGTNTNDGTHAAEAASGPTLDGRLKPDLVAGGYVDVRPFDGTEIALEEVRLVAAMGSSAADVVWTPGTTGPEWRLGSVLEGAEIVDGRAVLRAFGSETWVHYEPTAPIDAASYAAVSVRLEILDAGDPVLHRPPTQIGALWDSDGDDRFDRANWPHVTPGEGVQTYAHTLTGWSGTPHSLRVDVAIYESSSVVVSDRGGYRSSGGGTSLSAPLVSGAVALLVEQLRTDHGYDFTTRAPLPSTFKAILVHTATDMVRVVAPARDPVNPDTMEGLVYPPGPDWSTGYGLLDVSRAVDLLDAHAEDAPRFVERSIVDGEMHAYEVTVAVDGGPLTATLAWDDFAGSTTLDPREPVLVNDLDVVAVSPSGVAHGPWILVPPPLADDPFAGIDPIQTSDIVPPTRCAEPTFWAGAATEACEDHLNNVEQVVVDAPEPGTWTIRVRGRILEDDQSYSLVVTQACAAD